MACAAYACRCSWASIGQVSRLGTCAARLLLQVLENKRTAVCANTAALDSLVSWGYQVSKESGDRFVVKETCSLLMYAVYKNILNYRNDVAGLCSMNCRGRSVSRLYF